jgi:hypothetical protein
MNPNLKHRSDGLQFASLLRWVIVATFLGVTGLSYVYLKNQLHVCGAQRKALEQELSLLASQNSVMEARIAQLTSRAEIQRKLDSGFIKLVPINPQAIVRLRPAEGERRMALDPADDSQLHPISHDPRPSSVRR